MAASLYLFDPAELPPVIQYEKLFENLPTLSEKAGKRGRRPISRNSLLKALVYKALRRLATLTDLQFDLNNNPSVCQALGFNPLKPAPSVERFSSFLRDTEHQDIVDIRTQLVQTLLDTKVIHGKELAIDSCPITVFLKENNLKTSMADRFNKTRIPKGDPDARLGVMIHYLNPFKKKVSYFWGYRNHVVSDTVTELPLWEITYPANKSELNIAKPLITKAWQRFDLDIDVVTADANYDAESFLSFIINELKAQAIVPMQPRNRQTDIYQIKSGKVVCSAGLPMYRKGKMRPKRTGILYQQYTCPVVYDRVLKKQHIACPVLHPKFFAGKGCNALIRLEPSIRAQIDYGTVKFKEQYNKRTAAERVFSRLLAIAMQNPTVRGLQANRNHTTIAHIAVLLVARTANKAGFKDKIRFVKSFVPKFLKN